MREFKRECITVSIRIKPSVNRNITSSLKVVSKDPPVIAIVDRSQAYHFDHIFTDEASQEHIYNEAVKPLIDYVKEGFSATVFAYGQTGTGKTYTMGTASKAFTDQSSYHGIIPRALEHIFQDEDPNKSKEILISFLEIYNEKVFDLLQPNRKSPLPVSGFLVQDMVHKEAEDLPTALALLELGNRNRHIGETKKNISSSRSHAIFTVHFTLKDSMKIITGKLNLVDLAGLESVRKTGSVGNTFHEGININKGLLSIGQVISALSMKSGYIPYRQSMITSILQGSLNTENYISLIACVSSNIDDITETLQTLDFSQCAKKICSNPEVNQIITKYRKEQIKQTPLSRFKATPLKIARKGIALHPTPMRNEQNQHQVVDNSKTPFNLTSKISQEMLSPVIKKYMKEMEKSIMEKLPTVIQNTIGPMKKSSVRHDLNDDTENTPCIHWDEIQNKVSQLVKTIVTEQTGATSSPIAYDNARTIKRVLNYNSLENISPLSLLDPEPVQNDCQIIFKVPEQPKPKQKNEEKTVLSNKGDTVSRRRSTRILMKQKKDPEHCDLSDGLNGSYDISNLTEKTMTENKRSKFTPRRSVRLANKNQSNILEDDFESSLTNSDVLLISVADSTTRGAGRIKIPLKEENTKLECENVTKRPKRRSCRIKSGESKVTKRNLKQNIKGPTVKRDFKDSPYTSHLNNVLNTLNYGNLKQLVDLQGVGQKTAEQIMLYRKLRGGFTKIGDISKIPGWGPKKVTTFMNNNMLE